MMLDLKLISVSQRFKDLFSYRNVIIPFLIIEILMLILIDHSDMYWIYSYSNSDINNIFFSETNLYIDFSKILQETSQLRGIGSVLFSEYKLGVILAALLLFISMIASILLTMETIAHKTIKENCFLFSVNY